MAGAAAEPTSMSERPWWFPTAVPALVAAWAVTTLSFAIAQAAGGWPWAWAEGVFSLAVMILLARRFAAAEDAYRDTVRPPSVDRWGRVLTPGEITAMRLSAPVFTFAALVLALAAVLSLSRPIGGLFAPAALGTVLVAASFISARWGNPMKHTTQVWWPAFRYRWRTTPLLLGLFLLGQMLLSCAVVVAVARARGGT